MTTTAPRGIAHTYESCLESATDKPPPIRPPVVLDELQLLDDFLDRKFFSFWMVG